MTKLMLAALLVGLGCAQETIDRTSAELGAGPVMAGSGGLHWTVPPEIFGAEVVNVLAFTATKDADGRVDGQILYHQEFQGETFRFVASVTCVAVYDGGTRIKYGGVITESNDSVFVPGFFIWFTGIDVGEGAAAEPDRSSISGFGDEAANEAFCANPAPPRRSFPVEGNLQVRDR